MSWLSELIDWLRGKRKIPPPPTGLDPDAISAALLAEINAARRDHGRTPLISQPSLTAEVRLFAAEIAARGQPTHQGSDGSWPWDRAERAGYPSGNVGECVAAGQISAAQVVQDWMDDPPHQAEVLGDWQHFGGAVARGQPWGLYWVGDFGSLIQTQVRAAITLPGGLVRDQYDARRIQP